MLFVLITIGFLLAGLIWPRLSEVKTGETPEYPEILPQLFSAPSYRVFDAAAGAARELGWEVLREDRDGGEIDAIDRGLFGRRDEITIYVSAAASGKGESCTVNVHSRTRGGLNDFGSNARRIQRFQKELASRL